MIICGYSRRCFGCSALGPSDAGFMLGFKAHGYGAPGFSFLFGAPPGFPRRFLFCCDAGQGCGFGGLLGANFLIRQIGGAPFGFGPLARQPGEFFLLPGPGSGR
jgi:hypothetical protein